MTTPKSLRLPLTVLCALALSLAATGVAQAAPKREEVPFLGSLPGLFHPKGVAFDQANGTVLAADVSESEVSEVKIFSSDGSTLIGTLNGSEAPPHAGFAFSSNGTVGLAVDAAGNMYVSDTEHDVVDKFGPSGTYLCQYSGPGKGCEVEPVAPSTFGAQVAGLAVDRAGDLYVAAPHEEQPLLSQPQVDEFNPAGGDVTKISVSAPTGVAIDRTGDVFVQNEAQEVVEFGRTSLTSGTIVGETPVALRAIGISFDAEANRLLVAEEHKVLEYDPTTLRVSSEFETNTLFENRGDAIATQETPGSPTGDVYIVNARQPHQIERYGTPPAVKPAISDESVAVVTSSSVQLRATVDPELRDTHYVFQFGSDQSYDGGELPLPPGALISHSQLSALASVSLEGLVPGATYHYRVVATNAAGTTYGPDETFTTFQAEAGGLPDGRVWEMVSPLDKNGGSIEGTAGQQAVQTSPDGEKVTFVSSASFGAAQGNSIANQYLAIRTSTGWSTQNVSPPQESGGYFPAPLPFKAFSTDLSRGLLRNQEAVGVGGSNPPLPGTNAPAGYDNYYVRNNETNAYRALLTSIPTLPGSQLPIASNLFSINVEGVTPDLSHIVEGGADASPYLGNTELNEWSSGGSLAPVNVPVKPLTEGETLTGAVLGSGPQLGDTEAHVISDDGSRVFWSIGGQFEPVFVREGLGSAHPQTLQLPAGEFVDASAQTGSKVLLSTGEVYDVESEHRVADLTEGAGGFAGELGASEDLSKIYFLDTAVLSGAGTNSRGQSPQVGESNLYLYRESASPIFIATLAGPATARVTPDGESVVFNSTASLTGYDNRDAATESPDSEIFLYHASTGALACVSCNPTGQRPIGPSMIPAGNRVEPHRNADSYYQSRVLSSDGSRVFFDSPEALVEQDTNGAQDVYEYENGHDRLISSGTGGPASFLDADEAGENVFFTTANQLVPGDTDQLVDLYDARVDGGFPAPATETACTGTGCQGVPAAPPIFATPSSVTFEGVGNFTTPSAVATVKPKALTRAQQLATALKACHTKRGKKRATCEAAARHKYGSTKAKKARKARKGGKARK